MRPSNGYGLLLVLSLLGASCQRDAEREVPVEPAASAPQPASPDRLPPGELLEGEARAFGLVLPRVMTLESISKHTAHARGRVAPELLGNYLRARVLVQHVEMADKKLVFPKVHLRGDPNGAVLRLEIIDEGISTHLIVRNMMGPPSVPGLSNEQRWQRAGRAPGGALDPHHLE